MTIDVNALWSSRPRKPTRKTEADLYQMERENLPAHWTRNESGLIAVGAPDTNACHRGTEVWVENKIIHGRKVGKVRPSQVAWITERVQHGGRCFVAALTPDGAWLYLWHGRDIAALKRLGVDCPALFKGDARSSRSWQIVRRYLFNTEA